MSTYHLAGDFGGINKPCAHEICDSRGGSNRHGERNLVRDGGQRDQDALRGEILCTEAAGKEGHDLEREPLGLDHDHARQGKPDHDPPVGEDPLAEAPPALLAIYEHDVEEEQDGQQGLRDGYGNGSAYESEANSPHQKPVDEHVDWCGDDENVGGCAEEALRLGESFSDFEEDDAGDAEDHDLEIQGGEPGGLGIGNHIGKDLLGEQPQYSDG